MNTRKDNKGKALKAWINTPVGHIAKPLRHVINRNSGRDTKGNIILGMQAKMAMAFARIGDGLSLQNLARSMS